MFIVKFVSNNKNNVKNGILITTLIILTDKIKKVSPSFRYGNRHTLIGSDLILWLEVKRETPFNVIVSTN